MAARSRGRSRRAVRVAAQFCASVSRSPRRTSSCSLVSSRHTAASRGPRPAARSASVAARRGPVSNSTSVAGMRASSAMRARRAACFRRQKAFEQKPVGRQARDGERRQQRRGAGQRRHRVAGVLRGAHQLVARIGDERRAGIGHQRDRRAFGQPAQQMSGRACRRIVVVIGRERRRDAVAVEELSRHPRILAGDQVGARQRRERPQRDVAEIADRGRDEVQPRREPADVDLRGRRWYSVVARSLLAGRAVCAAFRSLRPL